MFYHFINPQPYLSKIISIGTALPPYRHAQTDISGFMMEACRIPGSEKRKVEYLYKHCGIDFRYSVLPDYSASYQKRAFYPQSGNLEPFPSLEMRMQWFQDQAGPLSVKAIKRCIAGHIKKAAITHLITVSCTGLSAPGLDISILQEMGLSQGIFRTSLNFMGCYGAIHALKIADAFCQAEPRAKVIIVCTELCTLHFQKEYTQDNFTSSLLFGDGAAAALVTSSKYRSRGLLMENFCSELALQGKPDMAWHLSAKGFRMTLSSYVPQLIRNGIEPLLTRSLKNLHLPKNKISHWAIHPGGKKILETVQDKLKLKENALEVSFTVLRKYGNMSSPTILFVLAEIMKNLEWVSGERIFAAAFGPGLTMESLIMRAQPS